MRVPNRDYSSRSVMAAENTEGPEPVVLPLRAVPAQILAQNAGFEPSSRRKSRAGDRIRTGDVQLGKLAFYH